MQPDATPPKPVPNGIAASSAWHATHTVLPKSIAGLSWQLRLYPGSATAADDGFLSGKLLHATTLLRRLRCSAVQCSAVLCCYVLCVPLQRAPICAN